MAKRRSSHATPGTAADAYRRGYDSARAAVRMAREDVEEARWHAVRLLDCLLSGRQPGDELRRKVEGWR